AGDAVEEATAPKEPAKVRILNRDEEEDELDDPQTMETNVPGLYLAGVICGGMETHKWFIENSRQHAGIIIQDILGKKASQNVQKQTS
ncbi:MAG: hypothetical protein ACO3AE_08855, partial [Robiginitalea sp.]